MTSICVFCGSSVGTRPVYLQQAQELGSILAARGLSLVYGGAGVGLMSALADAVLAAGGHAIGVIPRNLWEREVAHPGLSELRVVDSMHERKAVMADLSDGFIAMPGGIGTMEEFFEVWTWGQLGLHRKPYGLLNVGGYYDPLIAFLDHMVAEGFLKPVHRALVLVDDAPQRLVERVVTFQPPAMDKWLDRGTT